MGTPQFLLSLQVLMQKVGMLEAKLEEAETRAEAEARAAENARREVAVYPFRSLFIPKYGTLHTTECPS